MCKNPETFLDALVAELDDRNTIGIGMTGSYARAEAGPYSDLDILQYLRKLPEDPFTKTRLRFVDEILVSVSRVSLEDAHAALRDPSKAIRAIPGIRQMRILLDKDGSLAALKEAAEGTSWESMQAAADLYVSRNLSGYAEEIHKILDGLVQANESKTLYAIWGLTHALAETMLVQCGVLIQSENEFIDLAQQTAGRDSEWTHQFRLAIGLDRRRVTEPAFVEYGKAGLHLYRETARLLGVILRPEDAQVVNQTMNLITAAGY